MEIESNYGPDCAQIFSHLWEPKFKHNFKDIFNPLMSVCFTISLFNVGNPWKRFKKYFTWSFFISWSLTNSIILMHIICIRDARIWMKVFLIFSKHIWQCLRFTTSLLLYIKWKLISSFDCMFHDSKIHFVKRNWHVKFLLPDRRNIILGSIVNSRVIVNCL